MIPTPREVAELEEKIDDLEHDNSDLNTELADLLFERDSLLDRINRLDGQIRDWEGIALTQSESIAYLRDQSETYRVAAVNWEQRAADLQERIDEVQPRSSAWWEVAKQLVRVRDVWVGTADMWQSVAASRNSELAELKKALRVLGDGER